MERGDRGGDDAVVQLGQCPDLRRCVVEGGIDGVSGLGEAAESDGGDGDDAENR